MIIGIDPGKTGAIARVDDGQCWTWKMPETVDGLVELLEGLGGDIAVVVEKVSAGGVANTQGRKMGATSAFSFGCSYGGILGVLAALRIRHELVTPSVWTRAMSLQGKSKHQHAAAARRLYPRCEVNGDGPAKAVTIYAADAVLLAEYGRRFVW